MKKNPLKIISNLLNYGFFLLLIINSMTSFDFFLKRTGLNARWWLLIFITFIAILRFFTKIEISKKFLKFACFSLFPIIVIINFAFFWAENNIYTNFVFSTFKIHPKKFALIPIFFSFWCLIQIPRDWIKKYWKVILFLLPIYSFFVLIIISQNFLLTFKFLTREDSIVEWIEFIIFLITSFFSGLLVLKIYQSKIKNLIKNIFLSFFSFLCFALIVVAGEEISWGQRIFKIETPESWAEQNHQKELNFHNHKSIFQYVYLLYMIVGIYGGFSWILRMYFEKKYPKKEITKYIQTISPNWYLMFYFLSIAFYTLARQKYGIWRFREWEEIVELFLSLGIMFFIRENQNKLIERFE